MKMVCPTFLASMYGWYLLALNASARARPSPPVPPAIATMLDILVMWIVAKDSKLCVYCEIFLWAFVPYFIFSRHSSGLHLSRSPLFRLVRSIFALARTRNPLRHPSLYDWPERKFEHVSPDGDISCS